MNREALRAVKALAAGVVPTDPPRGKLRAQPGRAPEAAHRRGWQLRWCRQVYQGLRIRATPSKLHGHREVSRLHEVPKAAQLGGSPLKVLAAFRDLRCCGKVAGHKLRTQVVDHLLGMAEVTCQSPLGEL